ncbi:MAG: hypothetical protein M1816_002778 [Peltula sp. TS41687]|nr:MAG: hypothetical protein M1816_002778 [Peltula sp. TS41687]
MSNGDYDGDRYWIRWEPSLVDGFRNTPPPAMRSPEELGIEVDSETLSKSLHTGGVNNFLRKNLEFQLQSNVLGKCANYQESYSYSTNTISSPEFDRLADLRDYLADAPKNGYRFSDDAWELFLRNGKYPTGVRYPRKPAYNDPWASKPGHQRTHIVDFLKFDVITPTTDEFYSQLGEHFKNMKPDDDDLDSLYSARYRNACVDKNAGIKKELEDLVDTLSRLAKALAGYDEDIERAYDEYKKIDPRNLLEPVIREWHQKSLDYGPTTWSLLKASTLYAKFMTRPRAHFVFTLAGRELLYMKALQVDPAALPVTSDIMKTMKMRKCRDQSYVRKK